MGLHVRAQIGAIRERLPAMCATVRFLPGVGPEVALQEPRTAECLTADVTLVFEVVCEQVHGQRRHGDVRLPAVLALLGQLAVKATVRLLVAREVARRRVVLPALVACVALLP